MARGGRRAGAGRPTTATIEAKSQASQAAISRFSERALADLDSLYEAMRDLALGVHYEGCGSCKKPKDKCRCRDPLPVRIYQLPPNAKAGIELLAHSKGRAAQAQVVRAETAITLVCSVPRPAMPKRTRRQGAERDGEEEEG